MHRSKNRLGGTAPTIGVFAGWIAASYQRSVLRGLFEGAASAGANVLCFIGGALPANPAAPDARHRIYELAGPGNVDGVILLSSTIMHDVTEKGLAEYCRRFQPLPLFSIGAELEGVPSSTVANEAGTREVLTHLIRQHGARRIAFVRGPAANDEAERRFAAYRAVLAEEGLRYDERLVVPGTFVIESGENAVRELANARALVLGDLDAIAVANDGMAMGVLKALNERGIEVPRDVAVVGFDDIEDARYTRPPLTTVNQPLEKLGHNAVRTLVEWLQYRTPPPRVELPTELVIRRSCGCTGVPSPARPSSVPPGPRLGGDVALLGRRQPILDAMTRAAQGTFGAAGSGWESRLFGGLTSDLVDATSTAFLRAIQELMDRLATRSVDMNLCDDVLTALRREVAVTLGGDDARRSSAEDLFHAAHRAVTNGIQHALARERFGLMQSARNISVVCNALSATFDYRALQAAIKTHLPRLGIQACVVALYSPERPGSARIFAGYDRARTPWPEGEEFPAAALVPPMFPSPLGQGDGGPQRFAVLPLSWRDQSLGHMLLDLNLDSLFAYSAVAEAVGIAVRGAMLAGSRWE